MTDPRWFHGSRRSTGRVAMYVISIGFAAGALASVFFFPNRTEVILILYGLELTGHDMLALFGVPVGAYLLILTELEARSRYRFDETGVTKLSSLFGGTRRKQISYKDIEGASWGEDALFDGIGSITLYADVNSSSVMTLSGIRHHEDAVTLLKENVDELIQVRVRGTSGGTL